MASNGRFSWRFGTIRSYRYSFCPYFFVHNDVHCVVNMPFGFWRQIRTRRSNNGLVDGFFKVYAIYDTLKYSFIVLQFCAYFCILTGLYFFE